jgi:hypothetical protein
MNGRTPAKAFTDGLRKEDALRIPMKSPGRSEMMAPVGSDMMSPRARRLASSRDLALMEAGGQSLL